MKTASDLGREVRDCRGDIIFLLLGAHTDAQIKRLLQCLDRLALIEQINALFNPGVGDGA